MNRRLPLDPFDSARHIGTVLCIEADYADISLPAASAESIEVGEFVVIGCGELLLFGRVSSLREPGYGDGKLPDPGDRQASARIELLTTITNGGESAGRGIARFPRLGSPVFSAPPQLLSWLFECSQAGDDTAEPLSLDVASLADGTQIRITPARLFGRHCAVLGATGAGKSWTLARLVQEAARFKSKVVLFDATGEFHSLNSEGVRHVHIGADPAGREPSEEVALPFHDLTEADLFAFFKPSGPTQAPKLRAAMKSLKLVKTPLLATKGVIIKAGRLKAPFENAYASKAREVEDPRASFDIFKLSEQIDAECVFPWGGFASSPDPTRWGGPNEIERSNCVSLIARIEDMLHAPELACVFQPAGKKSIFDEIASFLADPSKRVLRISLKHLPFTQDAREIVANALGRHLLGFARAGKFRECPVVVFLDEAHHFLNKTLGNENDRYALDSFELIAKEGRKLSLNLCIATQRPRDIPEGILSQMGTFIIHRLNNDRDRDVVERASSEADRSVMEFVPGLPEGRAVIIGVDFPVPLVVQIIKPVQEPDSHTPDYQHKWQ